MAYQPTHPHPYLESIDATNPLEKVFSVVINPKDVITGYDFSIYNIDGDNDEPRKIVKKFTASEYLYGSEVGTILTVEVPDDFEMTNGKNYQWMITLYDANGASVESPLFYFSAKAMPVITLDVDSIITSCEHAFKATYSQEQNETYMYYQYSLYRDNVLIDETAEKIDSLLTYTYSGFVSGGKYKIDLTIATPDRKTYKISRTFEVEYEVQPSVLASDICQIPDNNCIEIDYSQNISVKGNPSGNIVYKEYLKNTGTPKYVSGVNIPDGGSIYYHKINEAKPLSLGEEFTIYYSVHFSALFIGDIIRLTNENTGIEYVVNYDGKQFGYKIADGEWIQIDPYVNEYKIHQERSVVYEAGTSMNDLNTDALHVLYDDDVITDDSIIMYNDITTNFWWTIVLLPDKVLVHRSQKYIESVVN